MYKILHRHFGKPLNSYGGYGEDLLCGRPHWGAFGEKKLKKRFLKLVLFSLLILNCYAQNKNLDFLCEEPFLLGEGYIEFNKKHLYKVETYSGDTWTGSFTIMGDRLIFNNDAILNGNVHDSFNINSFSGMLSVPGEYIVKPDFKSIFNFGVVTNLDGEICFGRKVKKGQKVLYENQEVVIPESDSYLYFKENTRMRDKPSLKAKTVEMPYLTRAGDYIETRNVVYKGDLNHIFAYTTFEETIDNVTSKWYLILEEDRPYDFADKNISKFVWVFGGWCDMVNENNYEYYLGLSKINRK